MFAPDHWVMSDSMPPDEPIMLFIYALKDSVVLITEKNNYSGPDYQKIVKRLGLLQKRTIQLMSSTALERYESFMQTYPDLSQQIP